jgi:glycosyltransferase domain-containing protein
MLKKLTIILTIKGRSNFTLRWMRYMNALQCEFKILIADGGKDESLQKILENKDNYPELNYEYIRYPYDSSLEIYYNKLCNITNKVLTPYVLYADNDDFIILDNIKKYLDFLDKNSDYVCCGGSSATLSIYSSRNKIINSSGGNYFDIRFDKIQLSSVDNVNGVERVNDFFKLVESDRLWFIWYDIQRTSQVKISNKYIENYLFKDVVSLEIYKITSLLLLGKSKRFEDLFYIRQQGSSEVSAVINEKLNVVERLIYINAFEEIINGLIYINKELSDINILSINKSFTYWFSEKVKILYFSNANNFWILVNKINFISQNFHIYNNLKKSLYFLRNFLLSKKKVYFLRNKIIENTILSSIKND